MLCYTAALTFEITSVCILAISLCLFQNNLNHLYQTNCLWMDFLFANLLTNSISSFNIFWVYRVTLAYVNVVRVPILPHIATVYYLYSALLLSVDFGIPASCFFSNFSTINNRVDCIL